MISVIISSVNKTLLANVRQNIADTIGVPFEIIAIDNSKGERGLCAVYNDGASRAQYDVLCFMHEDISLKTQNWGQNVINLFKAEPGVGLIGVAGSSYKPLTPSAWQGTGGRGTDYMNILQSFKQLPGEPQLFYSNRHDEKTTEVACVDGVWFCTTRQVLNKVKFDEDTFRSFHAYDVDFSMTVRQHYKVVVTYDVLLHHFSEGSFNVEWFLEMLKFHKKWSKQLPAQTEELTQAEKLLIEKKTFRTFIEYLVQAKRPMAEAYQILWRDNRYLKLFPSLFFKMHNFIRKAYSAARKEGRL